MKKILLVIGLILAALLLVAGCSKRSAASELPVMQAQATLFKSESCGCCGAYSQYLQREDFNVKVEQIAAMDQIKTRFKIPSNMQSCHTVQIGNYFIEGHMPMPAIQKLIAEQPNIAGIALPGMPSGSPGMPGTKSGSWIIYAVNFDGSYSEFMTI